MNSSSDKSFANGHILGQAKENEDLLEPGKDRLTKYAAIPLVIASLAFHTFLFMLVWDIPRLSARFVGIPLAADYANYWCAAKLALQGNPAVAYNLYELHELQLGIFGVHHYFGCGWYYPPTFLLLVLPFALFPYLTSLLVWIGTTFFGHFLVLARLSRSYLTIFLLGVAFPGVWQNILFGQNGFISSALLGGGLLLLQPFPLLGGSLFGLLSYKPNLALLPFFALLVGRQWRALIAAAVSALGFALISAVVFGIETWSAYLKNMAIPMQLLEDGAAGWIIMPTPFSAVLSLGLSVKMAYLVQVIISLTVIGGVAWIWFRQSSLPIRAAALILGTLLFTPYVFLYDLPMVAFALIWLWQDGYIKGRFPSERLLLLLGWLFPSFVQIIWNMNFLPEVKLQIGPFVLFSLFILTILREQKYGSTQHC
ncbi:MAG: glycosyltransferase family 87 protein [Deltaproteobacteria bacterium]|nr:glycosyltransferase family 87 protein [Deltaproteobacteria bacterium]